jgi:prepilin-type N-terminal cleavage/methylation domain-containing protein
VPVKNQGFTLVEALIALAILSATIFAALSYDSVTAKNTNVTRYLGTKNRVLSTIRESASLAATLRSSMLAWSGGQYVNPQLIACAGGNPTNSCQNGVEIPFTMFSPFMGRDPSGAIVGVQAISTPKPLNGAPPSASPVRVNSFGTTCPTVGPDCLLVIYTSMTPQCGPDVQPATPPTPINNEILPKATCTFADVIQVNYEVVVDPAIAATDPGLVGLLGTSAGSVMIPVSEISGNAAK